MRMNVEDLLLCSWVAGLVLTSVGLYQSTWKISGLKSMPAAKRIMNPDTLSQIKNSMR